MRGGWKHSPETRARMSVLRKGRPVPSEVRAKMSAAHSGKVMSPEARAKMSLAKFGKKGSLSNAWKGQEAGTDALHRHLPRATTCSWSDDTCSVAFENAFRWDRCPHEVKDSPRGPYCAARNPECYTQLCISHHVRFDKGGSNATYQDFASTG